jgi:tRNA A-37 threonylcarbamoyl transferase component Bud32
MQESVVDNRYSVVRTLGGGGMAKVYLARDEVLDRDVALKVLREQFAEDEEFVERFKREAQSAAALSHPNIVQVYDRGRAEDGASYIAMEYVSGGTLKERISRSGSIDPEAAVSLALQIAEALSAAHERGIVHRDIKPQNVLLTAEGDAKVTDFGIARAASAATISKSNVVLGSASYMSPEQAMGEPANPKSDLYSLGVVLYEMLTGELPYSAENPVAVSMKHVGEPLRPPSELDPRIPEDLNALVTRLMAKDPQARHDSAADLAGDLRRLHGVHPQTAGDYPGTTRVATRPSAQVAAARGRDLGRRPWILAAILVLLALIGALALSQGLRDSPPVETAEPAGVEVPDVEGLTEDQARQRLAGFEVDARRQESSAADAGNVVEQSPAPGERVERGSRVVIVVGNGPATVKVPDVVGLGISEAEVTLGEKNLTVGLRREIPSDTVPEGVVIEQGYRAGTEVRVGTAVNLGISSGPQQVVAPDASAPASAPATTPATAPASAPVLKEDNSGPGDGENSGPGSGGGGED